MIQWLTPQRVFRVGHASKIAAWLTSNMADRMGLVQLLKSMSARVQTPEDLVIKFFDADDEQGIVCVCARCLP